jgi:hypothetical protein
MKQITKILSVLLITALALSVGNATPPIIKPGTSEQAAVSVQKIYTSQIGVRELTGHNDGVQVEKYLMNIGASKGDPWCAAFVRWCFDQAGIKTTINAYSPTAYNPDKPVLKKNRFIIEPRAGDVFCLYFPKMRRIAHTGFFDRRINESVYETVEGNTNKAGSREGDGVYRKRRSFNATYVISRWT